MREGWADVVDRYRITGGVLGSVPGSRFGAFHLPYWSSALDPNAEPNLAVIVSDGSDWGDLPGPPWEHVSVSRKDRTPTWEEMSFIKSIFWGDDETVVQFHVCKKDHVNCHPNCLHLWKMVGVELPRPPSVTVGPKGE